MVVRSAAQNDCHLAFRLPLEHRSRLHAIAASKGQSLSELLREMCSIVLDTEAPLEPPPQRQRANVFVMASKRREAAR